MYAWLGTVIFVTPLSRQGGQTWGEALSWAGPSLQPLNPGQGAAVQTCTGAQEWEEWTLARAGGQMEVLPGPGRGDWRDGETVRLFGEQVGCTSIEVQGLSLNSWKIVFKIIWVSM